MNKVVATNIESGERLSFYKLFKEKGYWIEIPIIQRDYAQGRASSYEVREMFLNALYDYLDENKPNRDLDFVYGSIVENGKKSFTPLDGQQRLTTLFLLHWYLAAKAMKSEELKDVLMINGKSKFTYETRTSSSEFCDALMAYNIDFNNLLKSDKGKENSLSKTIRNCGWYYLSWKYDPTIKSMLTMLDSIHGKFSERADFFNRIVDIENPIITFLFLNLKDFKLTDDLYIKMNSRGKPLTPFENFKAKFEQLLENVNLDEKIKFKISYDKDLKEVSIKEYFSYKIDTVWSNLFWNYRALVNSNEDEIDNTYDDELMNFIRVIVTNQFILEIKNEKDESLEYLIGTQASRKRKDYSDIISFHKYEEFKALTISSILYLINSLDKLTNGENKIKTLLRDTFYFDENRVFEDVLKHKLDLPKRVQFHAYVRYLISNEIVDEQLYQWMRFVHNITENTPIDGVEEVVKAIKSIEKLLPQSTNIFEFLVTESKENSIDFFNNRQVYEERIKANLILKSDDWKNAIEATEKKDFLKGQISCILEYAGILEYFDINKNVKWTEIENTLFFDRFENYSTKVVSLFAIVDTESNKNFILERALLTKGDYLIPATSNRYNFSSTKRVANYNRDYSWKRMLRLPQIGASESEIKNWLERRTYIKEILDDNNFNIQDIKKSLKKICEDVPTDWRKYFVENPELIRYCEQGYIKYDSESKILLFMQSQQNHRHREMYSYNLYLKYFSKMELFLPFKKTHHYEIKSSEDFSSAMLFDWTYKRKKYAIYIYFDDTDKDFLLNPFEIQFSKYEGNKNKSDYNDDIIAILEMLQFKWDEESHGFWSSELDENKTISRIKGLCEELNKLTNE